MIALAYQFGPVLLKFGGLLIVALILLALTERLIPQYKVATRLTILTSVVAGILGLVQLQKASDHYQWEQEVNLSGNLTLVLRRHTEFGHYGELAQIDQAKSVVEDFEFTHPKSGQIIHWHGQYDLEPLLLDFDNDIPYLAAALKPGKHYAWGCPPYPYVFFKFENGQWTRIGIKQFPAKFEYANVLPYLTGRLRTAVERTGNHMTAYEVGREIGSWQSEKMLKIDRRIVNPMYFCSGSTELSSQNGRRIYITLDAFYGEGTAKRLGEKFGWNGQKVYLTDSEADQFGIRDFGEKK